MNQQDIGTGGESGTAENAGATRRPPPFHDGRFRVPDDAVAAAKVAQQGLKRGNAPVSHCCYS